MDVGFIGLGKLGLPCALAVESRGHDVVVMTHLNKSKILLIQGNFNIKKYDKIT